MAQNALKLTYNNVEIQKFSGGGPPDPPLQGEGGWGLVVGRGGVGEGEERGGVKEVGMGGVGGGRGGYGGDGSWPPL